MARMKVRKKTPRLLRSPEIDDEYSSPRPEYPSYLAYTGFAQLARQVVEHQSIQDRVELGFGKGERFDNLVFEFDIEPRLSRLLSGSAKHFGRRVNSINPSR